MTQPAPSLRDLSAHALFYSSSLNRPLLVSAKVSISRRGTEGWGSQSQHVKSDACANSHHKLQWTGSFHTIKRVMIILMFRVLQSQHSSKSIIRNPNTIKPSAPHSLYMGLGDTDRPIWNFYRFFLRFFFHSPLTHIYWNDNLLPQNYKHTQKKATLSLAKPQTSETKLNTLFQTCYLPSKLNCGLLLASGWQTEAAKHTNATEISWKLQSWIRTQATSSDNKNQFPSIYSHLTVSNNLLLLQ